MLHVRDLDASLEFYQDLTCDIARLFDVRVHKVGQGFRV